MGRPASRVFDQRRRFVVRFAGFVAFAARVAGAIVTRAESSDTAPPTR